MSPARISIIYFVSAAAWILISGRLWPPSGYSSSAAKGAAFVAVTSLLLWQLLTRYQKELDRERAKSQERLRQFRALVENAPFGVFIQRASRFEYVNPAAARIFGAADQAQLIGEQIVDLFDPSLRDQIRQRIAMVNERRQTAPPRDWTCRTLDGRTAEVQVSAIPFDEHPSALVYVMDITERVAQEKQFRDLAEMLPAQAWIAGADGSPLFGNQSWLTYTGLAFDPSFDPASIVHSDDLARARKVWEEHANPPRSVEMKLRLRRYDGEYRWFICRVAPLVLPTGEVSRWFGINIDVDESARWVEFRERAIEEERLRISHELHDHLGQLLATAKLNVELQMRQPEETTQRLALARDTLITAIQSTRDMATMLRPVGLEHGGLIEALSMQATNFQSASGIECRMYSNVTAVDLPYPASLAVYRTVQEALTNTAKHSGATSVRIDVLADGSNFRTRITDNGRGLPPAGEQTTGLGLVGLKERAFSVGGRLSIRSIQPGVQVEIELPLRAPQGNTTDAE
ncbi:MAG: PAS domain S-box protein [Bryobacterales bacterium]|nr:PAS domain S-box protein [Bryobacterales bacterium]